MTGVGFEPTTYGLKALRLPGLIRHSRPKTYTRRAFLRNAFVRRGTYVYGVPGHNRGTLSQVMLSSPKGPI